MTQVTGRVDSIYSKTVATKFGDKNVYYANINGQDINIGFKKSVEEGQNVTLDVEQKYGELQMVRGSGPKQAAVGQASTPAKNMPAAKQTQEFPVPTNSRSTSICRQSGLNRAVEVSIALLNAGEFHDGDGNLDQSEFENRVFELAYKFTDFSTGQREVKMANAEAAYNGDE